MNPTDTNTNKDAQKKPFSYNLLLVGVISLLTVGSWVTFEVYRAVTKTTVPRVLQAQIKPIKSKIDPKLMENIKERRQFSNEELQNISLFLPPDEVERIEKEREEFEDANRAGARLSPFATLATPSATPTPSIIVPTPSSTSTNSGEITL